MVTRDPTLRVRRGAHGVRRVDADTEVDLYRGLGRCHATDRALQMLLARILVQGRASECLEASDEMLAADRFFRRVGLAARAAADADRLGARERAVVAAYSEGVNGVLARRVPWELRLLGYRPEPWTPTDSLLVTRAMGFVGLAQSQGDMERLLVEMVQAGVSRGHLEELFPGLLDGLDLDLVRRVRLGERLVPAAVRWSRALPRAVASNNWAVAGRKTLSGRPILANDPHLETNRLPAVWYEVLLCLGDRVCLTATVPGVPAPILGRTDDLAWGATYAFMDAIDSWIEDCRDGCYRRTTAAGETWVPFQVRTETVARRGKPPVILTFHENGHGVLDGDPAEPGLYLATRWSGGEGVAGVGAILDIVHARTVADGMALLGRIETAWNWVLADGAGGIGYQMSGAMPARAPGRHGVVPLPGWEPANDWRGTVPPAELPRALNPASGFVVTANDDLNHLGRARPITLAMGCYRAERIARTLAARDDWSIETTRALQLDVHSLQAERFLALLRPLLPATPAAELLRAWDCRYDTDSTGAALFERFYRTLVADVFGAVCGPDVLAFLLDETGILVDFYGNFDRILLAPAGAWYGAAGRDATWRRVAAGCLVEPAGTWGERQQVVLAHLLLGGRLPRWCGFDRGPLPLPGGRATVSQGQVYRSGGRATSFAPSYRLVTDLGRPAVHSCLAGGPSDRRFSPWYASELGRWRAGRLKELRLR
jgi:penicillin amidase